MHPNGSAGPRAVCPIKMSDYSTFLLIDTALLPLVDQLHSLKSKKNTRWIRPLYGRDELKVSPVVVDVFEAAQLNCVEKIMELERCVGSRLCVSVIETEHTLEEVATHLKRFIFFTNKTGSEFTLRISDCAVLAALSQTLTAGQWSQVTQPFKRWLIHDRAGDLVRLPKSDAHATTEWPLTLDDVQIAALVSHAEPDRLLANLKAMRPDILLGWSDVDAHRVAHKVLDVWLQCGNLDQSTLMIFARAVFDTKAEILSQSDIVEALRGTDQVAIRNEIRNRQRSTNS